MYGKAAKRKAPAPGPYSAEEREPNEDEEPEDGEEGPDLDCKIYVSGLAFTTGWQKLKEFCEQVGSVTFVRILQESKRSNQPGWRSRGAAKVEFSTAEEATVAIEALNGMVLDGRDVVVDKWSENESRATKGDAAKPCPYFPLGKCDKGANCKWSHNKGRGSALAALPWAGGRNEAAKICPYFPLGKCDKGASCKWSHAPSGGAIAPGKVCPYFLQGKCDRGAECRWSHAVGGFSAGGAGGAAKVCPYFVQGKCDRGADCKWSHAVNGGVVYVGAGDGKVCPYFAQGKCDRGDECKWIHLTSDGPAGGKIAPTTPWASAPGARAASGSTLVAREMEVLPKSARTSGMPGATGVPSAGGCTSDLPAPQAAQGVLNLCSCTLAVCFAAACVRVNPVSALRGARAPARAPERRMLRGLQICAGLGRLI
eukprot:CAMPEP_0175385624 /NCGR_PEP_ID=MMETSP0095-20121207/28949_1 /TAXON_ID=311494 /ORGANISM="Alexandrium monilatum, Strain CCMP3105" /LENGTH=424 /DNA_ID=CAMNT_0016684069 /DNA_START=28 /DNA_END=1299 /DNA_ORIENTATION=+